MKSYQTILAETQAWAQEVFKKIDNKLSQMTLRSYDKLPMVLPKMVSTRKRASTGGPTASGVVQTISCTCRQVMRII